MKTRRKRKKRIGSSLLILLILLVESISGAGRKKDAGPFGLIGVTVFREPGFALPGAEVTLTPVPPDLAPKEKGMKGITGARGELVFRVPTAAMRYKMRAVSKGYVPQDKTVSIEGEHRIDATFLLSPESKQ